MDHEIVSAVGPILNSPLGKTAATIISNLFEPTTKVLGVRLAKGVEEMFDRRDARVAQIAGEMLDSIEYENPRPVAPKLLKPILESAALEDEEGPGGEDMVQRWASLLANASVDPNSVQPAFPEILRQLTHPQAKLFQTIVEGNRSFNEKLSFEQISSLFHSLGFIDEPLTSMDRRHIPTEDERRRRDERVTLLKVNLQNLERLRLFEFYPLPQDSSKVVGRPTELGRAFHAACQPPVKPAPNEPLQAR